MKKLSFIILSIMFLASCNAKMDTPKNATTTGATETQTQTSNNTENKTNLAQIENPTAKTESNAQRQSEKDISSTIKGKVQGDKVIFTTKEFELTLPKYFKDFYLEVNEEYPSDYTLMTGDHIPYFLIGKTEKKHIDESKKCKERFPKANPWKISEDCVFIIDDHERIVAQFKNGDGVDYFPSIDTLPHEIENYNKILEINTKNKTKSVEGIVLQYLKENVKVFD